MIGLRKSPNITRFADMNDVARDSVVALLRTIFENHMDVIKHGEASTSVDGVLTIVNGSHALTFGIESYSDADAESLSQNDNVVGFIESNDPDLISVMVLV